MVLYRSERRILKNEDKQRPTAFEKLTLEESFKNQLNRKENKWMGETTGVSCRRQRNTSRSKEKEK